MMTTRYDVDCNFEDSKSALQMGFRGSEKRDDSSRGEESERKIDPTLEVVVDGRVPRAYLDSQDSRNL